MKQLLLAVSSILAFTACSEDSISISPDFQGIDEDQAHISVYVAVEDLEANNGGCVDRTTYVHDLKDAEVSVFYLDEERPISADAILVGSTDRDGMVVFVNLPQGNFNIKVVSSFGTEQQKITTSLGKLTKVYVRF